MNAVWAFLEIAGGVGAVTQSWKKRLHDGEFEPFRQAALRRLPNPATQYPCPRGCGCAHRVVRYPDNAGVVAVCHCDPCRCDNIPITEKDLVLYAPDLATIGRSVVRAFGFHAREKEVGIFGMLQIGAFTDQAIPVILSVQSDRRSFAARVCEVVARLRQKFILVAPTATFMDSTTQSILAGVGALFIPLDASVRLTAAGALQTVKPPLEILEPIVPPHAPTDEEVVAAALGLIHQLDNTPKAQKPTHSEFFRLYCFEGLSLEQIKKRVKCSLGTVSNRKRRCEDVLGPPLERFRQHGALVDILEKQRKEARAQYVHSRAGIYDDGGFE